MCTVWKQNTISSLDQCFTHETPPKISPCYQISLLSSTHSPWRLASNPWGPCFPPAGLTPWLGACLCSLWSPRWRLNVWVAARKQRGEGRERERERRFRSAWGKGSLVLKEPFVAIISPGLPCAQTLWKVTLIPARRAGRPAYLLN